jgi:hypothetical protein
VLPENAEAEDVGRWADGIVREHLGRHIARRAEDGAAAGDLEIARRQRGRTSQAEVEQLHPVGGEEDVRGFEIAVHYAARVHRLQRRQDSQTDLKRLVDGDRPSRHPRAEGLAIEQLHDDEELLALLAQLVDLTDVGMTDAGGGPGLADEAIAEGRVPAERPNPFDRDQAAQALVPSLVDYPHATLAQLPGEDVMANGLELGCGGGGGLGGPLEPAEHGIKVGG